MSAPTIAALCFSVALLLTTAYFLMGSVPLLVLRHDTPVDARFIRGFFNTYYLAAMFTAAATALSFALAGRLGFAAGAACLAALAAFLRWKVIGKMDALRTQIPADASDAIPGFRKTHLTAIGINLVQLVVVLWGITSFSVSFAK